MQISIYIDFSCPFQDAVGKVIDEKKTTIERFNGDHNMWIGADYSTIEGKWKWRNAFVGFDGMQRFNDFR